MPAVLIVGDDEIIAGGMVLHLEAAGFDTTAASSGEQPRTAPLRPSGPPLPPAATRSASRSCRSTSDVQAYVDGVPVGLTPTEFKLLRALGVSAGQVVTRDELMQRIWGRRHRYRDRTVDAFVRKLREKIDRRPPRHTFIQTRYGVGYKLEAVSNSVGPRQAHAAG